MTRSLGGVVLAELWRCSRLEEARLCDADIFRDVHHQRLFASKDPRDPRGHLERADGKFGPDTCLPALRGNGKGPPEAEVATL